MTLGIHSYGLQCAIHWPWWLTYDQSMCKVSEQVTVVGKMLCFQTAGYLNYLPDSIKLESNKFLAPRILKHL